MENKLSPELTRRIDLHKFEKLMRKGIPYTYYDSPDLKTFKYKLFHVTLENYLYYAYNINLEEMSTNDVDNFIQYLDETFGELTKHYYNNFKKQGRV